MTVMMTVMVAMAIVSTTLRVAQSFTVRLCAFSGEKRKMNGLKREYNKGILFRKDA